MGTFICEVCGKEFSRRKRQGDACRCCSRECGFILYRAEKHAGAKKVHIRPVYSRRCLECENIFFYTNRTKKFCSRACSYSYNKRKHTASQHDQNVAAFNPEIKTCLWCGAQYKTTFDYRSELYCSPMCAKRMYRRNRKKRLHGVLIDKDISLERLVRRDDGVCRLCGKPVRSDDVCIIDGATVCGPLYPSVDHVVPLSQGGVHAWGNVQLAHRLCNSLKGAG